MTLDRKKHYQVTVACERQRIVVMDRINEATARRLALAWARHGAQAESMHEEPIHEAGGSDAGALRTS